MTGLREPRLLDWPDSPGRTIKPGSEQSLFHGYSRVARDRVEACVCGGSIRVGARASRDEIRQAVATHNDSTSHRLGMRRG